MGTFPAQRPHQVPSPNQPRQLLTVPGMTQMSIKGEFATDDDTERRRMAALEIRNRLAKEEGLVLETTRKV